MKKIDCIILARGGSRGLPNKNILSIAGNPLIVWSIKQAIDSKFVNRVYISSDNDEILTIAENNGAIGLRRPGYLAADTSSSEEVLKYELNKISCSDEILFLQATSPLRSTEDITNSIETFFKFKLDSLFSSVMIEDLCIWEEKDNNLNSINFDYKNRKRRQDHNIQYLENGSIYVFKKEILFKNNNRLGGKIGTYIMDSWKKYEIDNKEDFDLCEFYLNKYLKK